MIIHPVLDLQFNKVKDTKYKSSLSVIRTPKKYPKLRLPYANNSFCFVLKFNSQNTLWKKVLKFVSFYLYEIPPDSLFLTKSPLHFYLAWLFWVSLWKCLSRCWAEVCLTLWKSNELSLWAVWLLVTWVAHSACCYRSADAAPCRSSGSSADSRLSADLSQVVEELRQVGLEQSLKLQAQRHDALQGEGSGDEALVRVQTTRAQTENKHWGKKKKEAAYRGRGGDGVQAEEVAGVHFLEDTVQFGRLVVQEAQRCHCRDKHTDIHSQPWHIGIFFHQAKFTKTIWNVNVSAKQPPAKTI